MNPPCQRGVLPVWLLMPPPQTLCAALPKQRDFTSHALSSYDGQAKLLEEEMTRDELVASRERAVAAAVRAEEAMQRLQLEAAQDR